MYNLLVSSNENAWESSRAAMDFTRFGEFTAEAIKARFRTLEHDVIPELLSYPAIFAYEDVLDKPARIGRITRISQRSGRNIPFEFQLDENSEPLPPETLSKLAWELDIGTLEMNRTHWAIKDVDLRGVLVEAGLVDRQSMVAATQLGSPIREPATLTITPTVFSIPTGTRNPRLVSVMMPIKAEFTPVYEAIKRACQNENLETQRADDIWESSTIIQDVFELIYRSAIVVVDLSNMNPNVLYETGIAHTLGRPVVPISCTMNTLPFDLAHHRALGYLQNEQGLLEMTGKLQAKLRMIVASSS